MTQLQTLRIPRGLWADLEETVIQQDRQFLSEVARSLGLPVAEVLRRCLGTGAPTSIPVLWTDPTTDPCACPWWECHGDGLWRRCPRQRLSATLPCPIHERSTPCPMSRPDKDPVIRALRRVVPVLWNDELFWVDPSGVEPAFREDGTTDTEGTFQQIKDDDGQLVWARRLSA
jgi:hypothetical protein